MEPEPFLEHIASDEPSGIIEAVGKASEAFEYIERARGHLYSFHQLVGRADLLFGEAAEMLAAAGQAEQAATLQRDVVGRNVLDGRWTFQVVDEFDDLYYDGVRSALRSLGGQVSGWPPPRARGAHEGAAADTRAHWARTPPAVEPLTKRRN